MSITAFPVLARVLSDTGLHRTRLGALAITCAAVDDVTAWCVLSVVVAVAQASGAAVVIRTAGLAAAYVVVLFGVLRPLLAGLLARPAASPATEASDRVDNGFGNQTIALLIALVLVGASATEAIGIHAIFGAFLLGVVMPRDIGVVESLTAKLEDVAGLVLLPLFFVVAGLSTRVGLLDSPVLWAVTVLVITLAVLGKWGGSTLAARVCHMPWPEAVSLGVLMNTRGLTEIVILTIGLDLGIISPALFTVMVLMALVTTVMTVLVLSRLGVVPDVAEMRETDGETGDTEASPTSFVVGPERCSGGLLAGSVAGGPLPCGWGGSPPSRGSRRRTDLDGVRLAAPLRVPKRFRRARVWDTPLDGADRRFGRGPAGVFGEVVMSRWFVGGGW